MADCDVLSSDKVLSDELDEIERRRAARFPPGEPRPTDQARESNDQRSSRLHLKALCLSGGGIRSASFCLGVLQALAERGLLREFDYLSTVSGGGFIGSWLQMVMREGGGIAKVEGQVANTQNDALRRLRSYTNYLTPQTGPFSADTWAAIVLYLRNLLINWAIFAPLFLLLTLMPIFHRTAIWGVSNWASVNVILLVLASVALLVAVYRACNLIPSHRQPYEQARTILWTIVAPSLAWTLVIPSAIEFVLALDPDGTLITGPGGRLLKVWTLPAIYLVVMLLGYCVAWWRQKRGRSAAVKLFALNWWSWCAASAGSAVLLGLAIYLAEAVLPIKVGGTPVNKPTDYFHLMGLPFTVDVIGQPLLIDTAMALTVFAPLVVTIVYLLQSALYVALRRGASGGNLDRYDLDREWLARVSGLILRAAVGWTAFSFCCLVLPVVTQLVQSGTWNSGNMAAAGGLTAAMGSLAAWLGKIAPNAKKLIEQPGVWVKLQSYLPDLFAILFGILLLMIFGALEQSILGRLQLYAKQLVPTGMAESAWLPILLQIALAGLLAVALWASGHVNVNRFSMHAVYRNRLTRAFIGSAREPRSRHVDPFTGFDPLDNPRLDTFSTVTGPLPVINIALNITAGSNTAWAERKAASFTATPLACGSAALHPVRKKGARTSQRPDGAFVATNCFAGVESHKAARSDNKGPTLGTMLTVSGAAVSPSWGYHSSRLTAFLMTLFNVRLGLWLPNPATAERGDLRLAKPKNSLTALMNELIGRTTDTSQAIYLSDGGHFDNLGLYEMLRRRCRTILVVDAATDPDCAMFDLGDVIRKASIDLDVSVRMQKTMRIFSRTRLERERDLRPLGITMGTIRYSDGFRGILLYIKPCLLREIPAEIRAYATENTAFPHEGIIDQWFSESQFESYRALGACQLGVLTDSMRRNSLGSLYRAALSATRNERT